MKRVWLTFAALLVVVLASSWFVSTLWGGKTETAPLPAVLVFTPGETIGSFLERNHAPSPVAESAFGKGLDRAMPMASLPSAPEDVRGRLQKASALAAEGAGKNWQKIAPKFGLWAILLFVVAMLVRRDWLDRRTRKGYYLGAVVLFCVAFGSDPSPMGTVKDAIVLLAKDGAVFPPRLIALAGFLLTVVLANKAICTWGCQFGVLQDLVFRLNRIPADSRGIMRQYKVPFAVSNTVRIILFTAFTLVAFLMGLDLIEFVDTFNTFNPAHLGIAGTVFVVLLLVASLFVYRPWCHLVYPFGLAGWLLERYSLNRIRVDEMACTSCGACERACPTDVMGAILHRKSVIPDCFSCGTCTETCPTKAITFGRDLKPQAIYAPRPSASRCMEIGL